MNKKEIQKRIKEHEQDILDLSDAIEELSIQKQELQRSVYNLKKDLGIATNTNFTHKLEKATKKLKKLSVQEYNTLYNEIMEEE